MEKQARKKSVTQPKGMMAIKETGSDEKMKSGRVVQKPKILETKVSRTDMMAQSNAINAFKKKGKNDISILPKGIQESLKQKERIDKALNAELGSNTVDAIKKKYEFYSKPINLKKAKEITESRNSYFEEKRNKKTKGPVIAKESKKVNKHLAQKVNPK
ncbi:hypothetical protein SHELI_v1c05980 [Spiroplasma helicoides]|uniref:Uncharacterized protein n=1 Tax=Spiroplasma helicoides TaxID=216938 RepID=A0A1B3SKT3_9MOLU|nr:hypothetical protein [Spiroplasma helicoides]AOG60549.1 hypothetical protein SHELI_v1c05980 [Spiroplasma helicoides]